MNRHYYYVGLSYMHRNEDVSYAQYLMGLGELEKPIYAGLVVSFNRKLSFVEIHKECAKQFGPSLTVYGAPVEITEEEAEYFNKHIENQVSHIKELYRIKEVKNGNERKDDGRVV